MLISIIIFPKLKLNIIVTVISSNNVLFLGAIKHNKYESLNVNGIHRSIPCGNVKRLFYEIDAKRKYERKNL